MNSLKIKVTALLLFSGINLCAQNVPKPFPKRVSEALTRVRVSKEQQAYFEKTFPLYFGEISPSFGQYFAPYFLALLGIQDGRTKAPDIMREEMTRSALALYWNPEIETATIENEVRKALGDFQSKVFSSPPPKWPNAIYDTHILNGIELAALTGQYDYVQSYFDYLVKYFPESPQTILAMSRLKDSARLTQYAESQKETGLAFLRSWSNGQEFSDRDRFNAIEGLARAALAWSILAQEDSTKDSSTEKLNKLSDAIVLAVDKALQREKKAETYEQADDILSVALIALQGSGKLLYMPTGLNRDWVGSRYFDLDSTSPNRERIQKIGVKYQALRKAWSQESGITKLIPNATYLAALRAIKDWEALKQEADFLLSVRSTTQDPRAYHSIMETTGNIYGALPAKSHLKQFMRTYLADCTLTVQNPYQRMGLLDTLTVYLRFFPWIKLSSDKEMLDQLLSIAQENVKRDADDELGTKRWSRFALQCINKSFELGLNELSTSKPHRLLDLNDQDPEYGAPSYLLDIFRKYSSASFDDDDSWKPLPTVQEREEAVKAGRFYMRKNTAHDLWQAGQLFRQAASFQGLEEIIKISLQQAKTAHIEKPGAELNLLYNVEAALMGAAKLEVISKLKP